MPHLKTIFAELHYDSRWLDCGFLSDEFWQNQYSQYQTSDDKNTEHYRYEAFQAFLSHHNMLDEVTLDHYIQLASADPDRTMGNAALALLLHWPGLTDAQLQHLRDNPAYNTPLLRKLQQKILLLRELRTADISDESFERFLTSGDAEVHRVLLSKSGLKAEHLKWLQAHGANKAIRNMAKQKLQRNRS